MARSGFNGATAMKPWKSRRWSTQGWTRNPRFNGATAMKPWKRTHTPTQFGGSSALQWGHGDEAVEEPAGRPGRAA